MDWEAAIERQSDALTRILVALAAMAALLVMARGRLPRSVYRAVLRPLRATQAAALPFADPAAGLPSGCPEIRAAEEALLRRRFAALARAIADLIRQLLAPKPALISAPAVGRPHIGLRFGATKVVEFPDTS